MKARETNPGTESALSLMVDEAPPSAPLLDKLDWLLTVERPLNTPYLDALLLGQWGQGMVVSGDRVYIVNPHTGLYHSLRLRRNAESDDALFWLRETLAKARDKANGRRVSAGLEVLEWPDPDRRHLGAIAWEMRGAYATPKDYPAVKVVPPNEFDNRMSYPLFPYASGGCVDLANGRNLTPKEAASHYILCRDWSGAIDPMPKDEAELVPSLQPTEIASEDRTGKMEVRFPDRTPPEVAAKWWVEGRWPQYLWERLAWSLGGRRPVVDCLKAGSGYGKGVFVEILQGIFGEVAIARPNLSTTSDGRGDKFTGGGTATQARSLITFFDEAGIAPVPNNFMLDLCGRQMTVHLKGVDAFQTDRSGNAWFMAADWPQVNFSVTGNTRRVRWACDWSGDERNSELSLDTLRLLQHPRSLAYIWRRLLDLLGPDSTGHCDESRQALEDWRGEVQDPWIALLHDILVMDPRERTATADIRQAMTQFGGFEDGELPNHRNLPGYIQRAFPEATRWRNGTGRGFEGIAINQELLRATDHTGAAALLDTDYSEVL